MKNAEKQNDELIFEKAFWISVPDFESEQVVNSWGTIVEDQKTQHMECGDGLPLFRKNFTLADKEVKTVKLYSTALGVYDLYVNGQRVGNKCGDGTMQYDELKPGWTDYNKRVLYYTYDITDMLSGGENAVAACLSVGWWSGRISVDTYGSKPVAFMAKIAVTYADEMSEEFYTDTSWKTIIGGPILNADIWDGEIYDSQREIPGWSSIGYDDGEWKSAVIYDCFDGEVSAHIGPTVKMRHELRLYPESITIHDGIVDNGSDFGQIKVIDVIKANDCKINDFKSIKFKAGQTIVYDMAQNMVGWPNIIVKGAAGATVTMIFGEMLNDSGEKIRGNDGPKGSVYTANLRTAKAKVYYTLKGAPEGENYHPRFTFFGFRYMQLTVDQEVEMLSLHADVVGSDTRETGSLSTSNDEINKLYNNIKWGQRSNYLSIPTDCPQRDERLGWTGDTQIFVNAAAYNADVREFFHKWLQDMRDSQLDSGAYTDVVPSSKVVKSGGNAAWGDAGIIVPYVIYRMYADTDIIKECYESMEKYMDFLTASGYDGPNVRYGDWLCYEPTDKPFISIAYYAYDALLMSKMSSAISTSVNDVYTEKSEKYHNLYENIKTYFQSKYIGSDGNLTENSQTAYLLALKVGLIPNEYIDQLKKALVRRVIDNNYTLSTGFIGTGILNQTLSEIGESNLAYSLLLQTANPSWLYSVRQGATTIWERWNSYTLDKGFGDVSMNSFNHYAYGAVSEWMFRYMVGIDTDEKQPGFSHIILQPHPDTRGKAELPEGQTNITWVKASYDTKYGKIVSNWSMKDDHFKYEIEIPEGTTAEIRYPLINKGKKTLTISGVEYEFSALSGMKVLEDSTIKFELPAGTYVLE